MDEVRVIEIKKSVFANNDEDAGKLRNELKERGVYLLNLMSSPGAGKTTTLIGTLMLIVDHVINGELTWRFPFFTALGQAGGGNVMLREMLTVGVPMSLVLTAAWLVWALARDARSSRA